MNQHTNLLLAAENLQREDGLVRGEIVRGAFALKRPSTQTYLVVNELQGRVLAEFANPKSVPQVLENCICERKCPALREFYDLILKAHAAGILRTEELCTGASAPIERPAVRWFASIKPRVATLFVCLAAVAGVGALFGQRDAVPPAQALDYAVGWLIVCAALSLGQVLSAAALRGAGCEIYRPHLRWLTLAPHFAVDRADACMAGLLGRATIQAVSILPLSIATALCLWFRTPWSLLPLAALFFQLRPVGGSPLNRILHLLRRTPLLSTDGPQLFDAPMEFSERLRQAWRRFDGAVAVAKLLAGTAWSVALACIIYRVLHLNVVEVFRDWSLWSKTLLALGAAVGGISMLWFASEVRTHARDTFASIWRRVRRAQARWRPAPAPGIDGIELLIQSHPLLGSLDPVVQMELAACFKPFQAQAWRTLVKFNEPPPFVGLVVSGRVSLYRQLKSGRKACFLRLIESDLFGAHHLFEQGAGLEIRTNTPLVALALDPADFQRLVVEKLGPAAVASYLQKHQFLQRSSALCADWRPATIARFTNLVATASHAAGGRIIARGQEVPNLYVLYEGKAQERSKGGARIKPGDIFGETSLLQTSAAPADVECKDDSRSLVVSRLEFIRFMVRNHHVALQMERQCSKRLGHPLFPLDRRYVTSRRRAG